MLAPQHNIMVGPMADTPDTADRGKVLRARVHTHSPYLIAGGAYSLLVIGLIMVLLGAIIVGIAVGTVALPISTVWESIGRHLTGQPIPATDVNDRIIWQFRTPRVLLAGIVGAGLAVAGTALQALMRNPLADPYVLGISSGGSLAAVAVILLGAGTMFGVGVSLAAFLGAMATMLGVLTLGRESGRVSPTRLVLAGVALGAFASSITSYLQISAAPQQLQGILFWLLGTVSNATWADLRIPALAVVLTTGWLLLQARRLNALLVGEESATTLGIDVNRFRCQLIVVTSLLTGTIVAVSGGIGFVGLMIPHTVRLLVGADHRRVLPISALLGGSYLIVIDLAARTVQRPTELPLGIFTAAIGAPFFLWLMSRDRHAKRAV